MPKVLQFCELYLSRLQALRDAMEGKLTMLKEYSHRNELEMKKLGDRFGHKSKDEVSRIMLAKMVSGRSIIRLLENCEEIVKQSHDFSRED